MNHFNRSWQMALIASLLVAALVAVVALQPTPPVLNRFASDTASFPNLFRDNAVCPDSSHALEAGRNLEELARRRANRYAYDPGDGVRAVQRYKEAEACYRDAAAHHSTARARTAGADLSAGVSTDYAAARLNLANALEQRLWPVALAEIRRLLLLTEHLGRHEYVEWLKRIVGPVTARASAAS